MKFFIYIIAGAALVGMYRGLAPDSKEDRQTQKTEQIQEDRREKNGNKTKAECEGRFLIPFILNIGCDGK